MAMLLPRLQVSDALADRLKGEAEERNVTVGTVIVELVRTALNDRRLEAAVGDRETLFRILLAGEKSGLKVATTRNYPATWDVAGLNPVVSQEIAHSYLAWRREHDADKH